MKLFNSNGLPCGITLAKPTGSKPFAIRVTASNGGAKGGRFDTLFSIVSDIDLKTVYERAVYERLLRIGLENDKELEKRMLDTFGAFCDYYKITTKSVTVVRYYVYIDGKPV